MTGNNPKILIVEDDKNMGYLLKENMKVSGFDPVLCTNGQEGIDAFNSETFDLCLLDIMMPEKDGLTVATEIRKTDKSIPIIFLTAKSLDEDKISGFMAGCDDYVTKPFNIEELILRLRAVLKRNPRLAAQDKKGCYVFGTYTLNYKERTLIKDNKQTKLSTKEAELLKLLADHENEVVSRSTILKEVWGVDDYFVSKSLDVYLNKVRRHIQDDPNLEIINIHGYGYKLIIKE